MMYNKKIVRTIKKEIVNKYNNEFLLSKLTDDEKYVYDNQNYNFYFIKFNSVHILLNDDEEYDDNLMKISIKCNFIEIIFRWLKLKKIKFYVGIDQFKIKKVSIYMNYNKHNMKILFQILDFMKLFYKKYDNIGEII